MTAAETPRTDERATLSEAEREALVNAIADGREADAVAQHGPAVDHPLLVRVLRAECVRFVGHAAPAVERILAARLAAAVARAEAAEAKVDEVLRRIGRNLTQQHVAAEHHKRAGLDDRHHYSECHRFTQGRWGFYESARLLCQETDRDFEAFLSEHDPRHEEYDR